MGAPLIRMRWGKLADVLRTKPADIPGMKTELNPEILRSMRNGGIPTCPSADVSVLNPSGGIRGKTRFVLLAKQRPFVATNGLYMVISSVLVRTYPTR
jgi:hypothetical protein